MTVTLSEKAEFHLRSFLRGAAPDTNGATKGVRISVKDGGCSGYEYAIDITSKPQPDDLVIQQGKVMVYVDAKSAPLLDGIVVDFVEGVMESGFKFINPNATDTCGCGKSLKQATVHLAAYLAADGISISCTYNKNRVSNKSLG